MNDRFHKAAKDGNLDILKTGRKTDLNEPDADGMTPTLYAAYHGNLPALTLCCSRGGDPNKFDYTGNSALHLCVQKSRMECIFFLVEFGANIWQQDNDFHSPLDRAIINGDKDCERYLDGIVGKQRRENPKKVQKLQIKAKEAALKNIEKYKKLQAEWDRKMAREFNGRKLSTNSMPANEFTAGRRIGQTLNQPPTKKNSGFFSTFSKKKTIPDTGFKISVNERKVSQTLDGFQSEQVASVMYRQPEEMMRYESAAPMTRRAPIDGVFPDESKPERDIGQLFGTINLRQNTTSARSMLSVLAPSGPQRNPHEPDEISPPVDSYLLGAEDDVDLSDASGSEEDEKVLEIERFLSSLKLQSLLPMFLDEDMDMETLEMCDNDSLKEIGVTFGPRIKILKALKERKEQEVDQSELTLF